MALLLRSAGSLGPSMPGRDNCRGTLQQGKGLSLHWKVVKQLVKLMRVVTAAIGVCGRSGKAVFVGGKGFEVSDVVTKHLVMVWCF